MQKLYSAIVVFVLSISIAVCAVAAQNSPALSIKKLPMPNGLTILVREEPGSGLVAISAMVKVGTAEESIMNAGIGNYAAQLLLSSTINSSPEKISAIAGAVGGNISSQWNQDYTEVRAVTTSDRFDDTISLIAECLMQADFDSGWVNLVRSDILKQFTNGNISPFDKVYSKLRELLYEDNGYRRPPHGLERVVRSITPQDLRKFHAEYYVPNNTVVSVVGDVKAEQVHERAKLAFAGWSAKALPKRRPIPDEKMEMFRSHVAEADVNIAYLMLGWLAPNVKSEDYAAVAVATNTLGGGKGSLMFIKLRQEMGMGYELGSAYPRLRDQSHVLTYVATDPFKFDIKYGGPAVIIDELKTNLLKIVDDMKTKQLTERELRRAKGYTIGQFARSHQHLSERATDLAWFETVGVGYDMYEKFPEEVEKVSAEDVQRVAKKYFSKYAVVVLLPTGNTEYNSTQKNKLRDLCGACERRKGDVVCAQYICRHIFRVSLGLFREYFNLFFEAHQNPVFLTSTSVYLPRPAPGVFGRPCLL